MARKIYNFELFTNKKEQLRRIQLRRIRRRRAKIAFFAGIFVLVLIVIHILNNSRCNYYVYKEVKEMENSAEVSYQPFARGYIKYSNDGAEYQKHFGRAVWNVPVSYQHPYSAQSTDYFLLADKSSNVVTVFDENGLVNTLTLKYPVMQAGVSKQGIIDVILAGDGISYVQMYDKDGTMIADMKASVDETGYPLACAISPDGTKLAVSYYSISGMDARTSLAIYDFSRQLQGNNVGLLGGFEYRDVLIPKLSFTSNNTLAAFGQDKTFFYDVSDAPELTRTLEFGDNIESVFEGNKYIGYVLDNKEDISQGRFRLCLYSKKGLEKLNVPIDMNYDTIRMLGNQIIAYRDNECTIINTKGKILFQEALEGNGIASILPAFGWRSYYVVFRDRSVKMCLRFWGED